MTRREKRVGEILDRFLERFGDTSPTPEQTKSAGERVLRRLRSEADGASKPAVPDLDLVRSPGKLRRLVIVATAAAAIVAVLMSGAIFRNFVWPRGAYAVVETVDGALNRISAEKTEAVRVGDRIESGQRIRSNGGAGAVLTLADGSRVEMRSRSEILLESADDGIRILLSGGSVIVSAAQQRGGHLYVQTKDLTVSVVGTVFLVETSDAGSHVTVIQGEVLVRQGAVLKTLRPGEQVATAPLMDSLPVAEEIAWSRHWEAYLAALQKSGALPVRLEFQAASIKLQPGLPNGDFAGFGCHGTDGMWRAPWGTTADSLVIAKGRCTGNHVVLSALISAAYDIKDISGGPDWLYGRNPGDFEGFQIQASADDPSTATTEQLKQMLQTLLSDRFKLKFHRDSKEAPGHALVVGKNGPKFKQTLAAQEEPIAIVEGSRLTIKGKSPLKKLADFLPRRFPELGIVLDKTELTGTYDYTLMLKRRGAAEFEPSVFTAVQDQLGLKLEPQKVPVEIIVIDDAQKPTEP